MPVKKFAFAIIIFSIALALVPAAQAQGSINPKIVLSSNEVSFFNGDQSSVQATVTNNDLETRTFTISIFPGSLEKVSAFPSLNHVTLAPGESRTIEIFFSSLFEAEFIPRQFTITASSTEDKSIATSKEVFVRIVRKSPVFVLSLSTNSFSYKPGNSMNITSIVSNNGGDNFDDYVMRTSITKDGEILKRFESVISFLPERSNNAFSNIYTFDKFAEPGLYSVQVVFNDPDGQLINTKSINFRLDTVDKTSQSESSTFGIIESVTTLTATNEGNSPADIKMESVIPGYMKDFFSSSREPVSMQPSGSTVLVTWIVPQVQPAQTVTVTYSFAIWKIWATIIAILVIVVMAFRFVFKVKIIKRSHFAGKLTNDTEVPVMIEIVNRSMSEVKDVVIRDFVPPITKVVNRFETIKPSITQTTRGTELVWKFDSLHPGEERVVAYRIKPKMDVLGRLVLNPATINYSTKKREKKSAASGGVTI